MAASIAKHEYCKKMCSLYKTTYSAMLGIHKRGVAYGPVQKIFPQDVKVDPCVQAAVESGAAKFRKHDGSMRQNMIAVPDRLQKAVDVVLEMRVKLRLGTVLKQTRRLSWRISYLLGAGIGGGVLLRRCPGLVYKLFEYPSNQVISKAKGVNDALLRRQGPIEQITMRQRYNDIRNLIKTTDARFAKMDEIQMTDEEDQFLQSTLNSLTIARLRKTTHNWSPIKFSPENCLTYMVARLARHYAVMKTIFDEIKKRDAVFKPGSIYDNHAGLGTTVWAANSVWEKSVFEYYCVNPSTKLTSIARLLLQNGSEAADMCIPGVFFRQFRPADKEGKFRMSVSAYTLMEQQTRQERLDLVQHLWTMTDTYLVLVEMGTNAGYQLLMEARNFILQSKDRDPQWEGHVFAPCPHEEVCPKLQYLKYPCTFDTFFKQLIVGKTRTDYKMTEKYSYLVMKKSPRPSGVTWPRVAQPTVKKSRHTHCYLCCPDGTINHTIVTRKKHESDLYSVARYSIYGDLLPVLWTASKEDAKNEVGVDSEVNDSVENIECSGSDDSVVDKSGIESSVDNFSFDNFSVDNSSVDNFSFDNSGIENSDGDNFSFDNSSVENSSVDISGGDNGSVDNGLDLDEIPTDVEHVQCEDHSMCDSTEENHGNVSGIIDSETRRAT